MGFPADRAGGARKKFFSPNPVEFWLDAWCLPCLQDAMENSTLKLLMTVRDHLVITFLMVGNPPKILAFPPRNFMCWCLLVDHTGLSSQTTDLLTLQTEPCLT